MLWLFTQVGVWTGQELCWFGGGVSAGLGLGARKLLCEVDDLLRLAAELRGEGESVEDSRRLAGEAPLCSPLDNYRGCPR